MAVAVPIFAGLMLIMLIVSIPILLINIPLLVIQIVKIRKKIKFNKIIFCLSIIGTVFGLCLFSPPVILVTVMRQGNLRNNPKIAETGITISWQKDNGGEGDSFLYNNKEYKYFADTVKTSVNRIIEIDKPIANIVSNDNFTKTIDFLFGGNSTKTLYTIRNIDSAILTTGELDGRLTLYCDSEFINQKTVFYSDLNNYLFFFTKNTTSKLGHSKSIDPGGSEKIIEIANFKGEEFVITTDKDMVYFYTDGYNYINIFGVSKDRLMIKNITTIMIDDDTLYRFEYTQQNKIYFTKLNNSQKDYILTLIN